VRRLVEGVDHTASTPRPGKPRSSGSFPARRRGCPAPLSSGRRSVGRASPGHQAGDGQPVRQPLPGRPALVGATVERCSTLRPEPHPGPLPPAPHGRGGPLPARPSPPPAATADPAEPAMPGPSGIDYLAMVEQRLTATQRRRIAYASLPELPAPTLEPARTIMPPPVTQHRRGHPARPHRRRVAPGRHDRAGSGRRPSSRRPTTPPVTNIQPPDTAEDAS
jgi:hypothetical protein